MAKKFHFKNLKKALLWRKRHPHKQIHEVDVVASNPPHVVPATTSATKHHEAVSLCHQSLAFAGSMIYTMGSLRSQLFGRAKGNFKGAHADCSQYYSAILKWLGSKIVTSADWTGSLWDKAKAHGKILGGPRAGCGVIFGAHPGEHIAFITERDEHGIWWTIGFGHAGAPDHVSLPDMKKYFEDHGFHGVTYIDLLEV